MKALWACCGLAFATSVASAAAATAADVAGEWWTPGFVARVRLESCGDAVCGRIVWVWDDAADNRRVDATRCPPVAER